MEPAIDNELTAGQPGKPSLTAWLWRPWYAKLWWATIPFWWLGAAAATRVDFLAAFYGGAIAGYLNVLFFPMTALMVLGVGYVRERLDGFVGTGGGTLPTDEEAADRARRRVWEDHERAVKNSRATTDMFDPRSGSLWIGNPLNPHNPGYINPHPGKHF